MKEDTEKIPMCFTFYLGELFTLLSISCILGACLTGAILIHSTNSQVEKSDAALTQALQKEKQAETAAAQYKFTLEKLGTMMQSKCNKDK